MGRSWKYVAAWLATTSAAVTVSWLGVRVGVAPALTREAPVAIDVDRRYTEVRLGVDPDTIPSPTPPAAPSPSPSVSTPAPAAAPPPPTVSAAAPSSPTDAPTTADRRAQFRVPSQGGSALVAFGPDAVDVVSTSPESGYTVTVTRRSATSVVIRFAGSGHASTINAFWLTRPVAQVVEEFRR